jgi:hypothetical protein
MAAAIVNPRMLNIAKPNARLRARQRIIRARMGKITPPPIIATPAPAETPALTEPEFEPEEAPTPEPSPQLDAEPIDAAPEPEVDPEPAARPPEP